MSAKTIALQAAVRAICEAETEQDNARADNAVQRALAWSAIAANLHPDIPNDFITRLRAEVN